MTFRILAALSVLSLSEPIPSIPVDAIPTSVFAIHWTGSPYPSVDCVAYGAGMRCKGASLSATGAIGSDTSPYPPLLKSATFGGSSFLDGGTSAGECGGADETTCIAFLSGSGTFYVESKGSLSAGVASYTGFTGGTKWFFCAAGLCSSLTRSVGGWNVACHSYKYNGASSVLSGNIDGTAGSITVGVLDTSAYPFRVGTSSASDYKLYGRVARITKWCGWAASGGELSAMVSGMIR